jgi:hypothetical protein
MRRLVTLIAVTIALSACSSKGLRDLRHDGNGPDEFMVQPVKPLAEPSNYSTLPTPTPGRANLTDRSALQEGIVAFGGNPAATAGGIPANDAALVQHASRMGVNPAVREQLAADDAKFRKRKERFTSIRLVPVDRYDQAYRRQALNAQNESARWRRAGARTPSSPPARGPSFQ